MKNYYQLLTIVGTVALSFALYAENKLGSRSEEQGWSGYELGEKNNRKKLQQAEPFQQLKYIPPSRGALTKGSSVGGGVRGLPHGDLLLSVLTPDHVGQTAKSQPDLYWYLSQPVSKSFQFIEFVLVSERLTEPVLRTQLTPDTKSGIQKMRLSNYGITLEADLEYTWSIALVRDPDVRSLDLVSSGKIKYKKPDNKFRLKFVGLATNQHPYLYARAGFWYDSIAGAIEQAEELSTGKENLFELLKQVKLDKVVVNMKGRI